MSIVINLSKEAYDLIIGKIDVANIDLYSTLIQAVKNGTPLPKDHGRLIDADALIDTLGCSDRDIYVGACIEEDAQTIIEADKGE